MRKRSRYLALALIAAASASSAQAAGLRYVKFVVVSSETGLPVPASVTVTDDWGRTYELESNSDLDPSTREFDTVGWTEAPFLHPLSLKPDPAPTLITITEGAGVTLQQSDQVPVKEITIHVTATRLLPNRAPAPTAGTDRSKEQLKTFIDTTTATTQTLTKGQAGVTEDSAGQQHVRGEHTDITYVVDGVPLPDTLSGRAGAIVVPSTIQDLQIIMGGFAPEFGGQVAAVLNIATLSTINHFTNDLSLQGGDYGMAAGDFTSQGPLGSKMNYVLDLNAQHTDLATEAQQPDNQTAHNEGSSESAFGKLHFTPNSRDAFTLTLSEAPDTEQIGNRTGLPSTFYDAGEGYGFLGFRNADGTIAQTGVINPGGLGSAKMVLPSQQQLGMDINQSEVNEFAILNFVRHQGKADTAEMALTLLHSGQNLTNNNPSVDVMNLPVDNSIEYNPTAYRNVHHLQLTGNYEMPRGQHDFKFGFLGDQESGVESYHVVPASQLALDELAALDPGLAPAGTSNPKVLDVYGNPVYTPTSAVSPTLIVQRTGFYQAAYAQDTWKLGHLTTDYGVRFDWYYQHENVGDTTVNKLALSPRLNFDYNLDRRDDVRWSYNRLFNTPPLAQGGLVGLPIVPETINQYDLAFSRKTAANQTFTAAYYYKQIMDQVDVGLLIPGSEIGLYSAVNFQQGAVHGTELSYDVNAPGGIGWDEYTNFTYSAAMPNGLDNQGQPAPDFNDHDQRITVGLGLAYTWKAGYSIAATFQQNSGLASSTVPPSTERTPRSQLDLHMTTGDRLFKGRGGLELDISNVFDSRQVINFESGFSGTRFQEARTITAGAEFHF